MRDSDWYSMVAGFFVLGVLIVGAVAIVEEVPTARPGPVDPTPDYLYLTVAFNPMNGADEYFPANFTVPSHSLVEITITNFDNGSNPVPTVLRSVSGTLGDTETVVAGNSADVGTLAELPAADIAHTFSIPAIGLNVPIASAPSAASPSVTSFEAYFNETGSLMWMCQAPCDPVSMMMLGLMSGTITVD